MQARPPTSHTCNGPLSVLIAVQSPVANLSQQPLTEITNFLEEAGDFARCRAVSQLWCSACAESRPRRLCIGSLSLYNIFKPLSQATQNAAGVTTLQQWTRCRHHLEVQGLSISVEGFLSMGNGINPKSGCLLRASSGRMRTCIVEGPEVEVQSYVARIRVLL